MLFGDIGSLQKAVILELEKLYQFDIPKNDFLPDALVLKLAELTGIVNNEIAVYITRKGKVAGVVVGDHCNVYIPEINKVREQNVLSGIRCLHTHAHEDSNLSPQDIRLLLSLRLDGIISIGTSGGKITTLMAAIPTIGNNFSIEKADFFGPFNLGEKDFSIVFRLIEEIDGCLRTTPNRYPADAEEEKVLLIGFSNSSGINDLGLPSAQSLYDLEQIAKSVGAQVLENLILNISQQDPNYYVPQNKISEIIAVCKRIKADMVILDCELSGIQLRNLEEAVNLKFIDRDTLILDIFARRASSRECKIQVELAQLKYIYPRLSENGLHLPSLEKGIGTLTPCHKKLEFDRKNIRSKIRMLAEDLEEIKKDSSGPKENRRRIPTAALVGFVNSGKATLINTLCNLNDSNDDALVSSASATSRKISLPNGEQIAIVDSVGFIKNLPPSLVEEFKLTLEEVKYADIIIHVVDSSIDEASDNITDINNMLHALGVSKKPTIVVFTKADIASKDKLHEFSHSIDNYVEVSSTQSTGIDKLLYMITKLLFLKSFKANFFIPSHESWFLTFLHENAKVITEDSESNGTKISAHVTPHIFEQIKQFSVDSPSKVN